MEFKTTFYFEKTIQHLEVDNGIHKYNISIQDLFDYLERKNKKMKDIINSNQNKLSLIKNTSSNLIEPQDEFSNMDDETLIQVAFKLIQDARRAKIKEFYHENKIQYRPFNLTGLVSNNIIITDNKRKIIRDLCRKCHEYLYDEKTVNKPEEKNTKNIQGDNKTTSNISQTCIYKFKRGVRKGELCNSPSLENKSYCKSCYNFQTSYQLKL
jgi:hypothetical protein